MSSALIAPPLTIDEVADRWRMSRDGVYRLMAKGDLPWLQVSARRRLIALEDVEQYEQGVRRASSPPASPEIETESPGPSFGAKTASALFKEVWQDFQGRSK